ncbi:cysteine hydrolase family protein [Streptomyces justiciae]|uniref:Cysteine hydrolase n=1 Tax=Streptomyces justiciae TaxID=2780140 RepID=A0ABU3M2F0_9ACTN|nr:cysteine hydrolase [Streptomyces justiciae]MDT7845670.1 cysteine hydrolase [Streptomyces justiciae]
MTSTYPPGRTGLLLIDTVNDVFAEDGKGYPLYAAEFARIGLLGNLTRLLAGLREKDVAVFFSPMSYTDEEYASWRHPTGLHRAMFENRLFEAGSWGAEFHPELSPAEGEVTLAPHKNIDVFATTDLDTQLRRRGVEHLALGGMIGTMCVESTARSAMERGYHVTMLSDATASDGDAVSHAKMLDRYALFAHAVLDVDGFLAAVRP